MAPNPGLELVADEFRFGFDHQQLRVNIGVVQPQLLSARFENRRTRRQCCGKQFL